MKILGIQEAHNASACLLIDGKIIGAICEERLTRRKNEPGYPKRAIDKLLEMGGCSPEEIDIVALGSRFVHRREFFLDWNWYKKGEREQMEEERKSEERKRYFLNQRLREREKDIYDHLKIGPEKIVIIGHHLSHASAAYYGSQFANTGERVLVLTLDGSGDGICSTVNIAENGNITKIAETPASASLGKIYSRITYLLGMIPWEHEYKVMGLAPYADKKGVKKSYEVLSQLIELAPDGLTFRTKTHLHTNYCYFWLRDNLENHRFDWIAGAVQKLQEDLVVQWVKNAISKTGIRKLVCGGGSFMNVKTNMLLHELEEVEDIFVFPGAGDESLSIGAAYKAYADYLQRNNKKIELQSVNPNYFGPEYSEEEIRKALEILFNNKRYSITREDDINKKVASLLASGEIVAVFWGRMEWGPRALGNRSILMDPRNTEKIRELNEAVKQRDFWMPFAPTILAERANEYIINPKNIKSPFMTLAFRTTPKGRKDLAAAIHPYDMTCRPQILEKEFNPHYYDLIKKFEKITGVGAVLNTSFNLHGEPIVCSPEDAISTLERSSLKFLTIGNYLVRKNL